LYANLINTIENENRFYMTGRLCCARFRNVNNWHINFVDIGKHDDIANNATYGINTANNNRIIDDDRNQGNVDVYNCDDNRYV